MTPPVERPAPQRVSHRKKCSVMDSLTRWYALSAQAWFSGTFWVALDHMRPQGAAIHV